MFTALFLCISLNCIQYIHRQKVWSLKLESANRAGWSWMGTGNADESTSMTLRAKMANAYGAEEPHEAVACRMA